MGDDLHEEEGTPEEIAEKYRLTNEALGHEGLIPSSLNSPETGTTNQADLAAEGQDFAHEIRRDSEEKNSSFGGGNKEFSGTSVDSNGDDQGDSGFSMHTQEDYQNMMNPDPEISLMVQKYGDQLVEPGRKSITFEAVKEYSPKMNLFVHTVYGGWKGFQESLLFNQEDFFHPNERNPMEEKAVPFSQTKSAVDYYSPEKEAGNDEFLEKYGDQFIEQSRESTTLELLDKGWTFVQRGRSKEGEGSSEISFGRKEKNLILAGHYDIINNEEYKKKKLKMDDEYKYLSHFFDPHNPLEVTLEGEGRIKKYIYSNVSPDSRYSDEELSKFEKMYPNQLFYRVNQKIHLGQGVDPRVAEMVMKKIEEVKKDNPRKRDAFSDSQIIIKSKGDVKRTSEQIQQSLEILQKNKNNPYFHESLLKQASNEYFWENSTYVIGRMGKNMWNRAKQGGVIGTAVPIVGNKAGIMLGTTVGAFEGLSKKDERWRDASNLGATYIVMDLYHQKASQDLLAEGIYIDWDEPILPSLYILHKLGGKPVEDIATEYAKGELTEKVAKDATQKIGDPKKRKAGGEIIDILFELMDSSDRERPIYGDYRELGTEEDYKNFIRKIWGR